MSASRKQEADRAETLLSVHMFICIHSLFTAILPTSVPSSLSLLGSPLTATDPVESSTEAKLGLFRYPGRTNPLTNGFLVLFWAGKGGMGQPARQRSTTDGQPTSLCCIFGGLVGIAHSLMFWAGHRAGGDLFVRQCLLFPFPLSSPPRYNT